MKASFNEFNLFNFHDSYVESIDEVNNIWYLEAVNVLPELYDNNNYVSMRASLMKLSFENLIVENADITLNFLANNKFEILDIKEIENISNRKYFMLCMEDGSDYIELEISFTQLFLEWERYEDKSWYVYFYEEDYVKKYIEQNDNSDWMYISKDKKSFFNNELKRELVQHHKLFGLKSTPLSKREDNDDVLYSLSNGKIAIVHLTYCKENSKEYPKFILYNSVEEALNEIY